MWKGRGNDVESRREKSGNKEAGIKRRQSGMRKIPLSLMPLSYLLYLAAAAVFANELLTSRHKKDVVVRRILVKPGEVFLDDILGRCRKEV